MAEAVVSTALETFRDLLLEEGRFLAGVRGEVKALQTQLKEIKCFLQDADKRRHESKTIFNWIVEIRDLAYRAEAAIEIHAARGVSSRRRRGLRQLVRRCSCILQEGNSLHQLGSEISQIKSHLGRISKDMQENGVKRSIISGDGGESSASNDWSRKTFPNFEMGECFVGMEVELKQLLSLLMEDKHHRVISVWGMGGSGKTTIARKVYNHIKNSSGFDSLAWVCISQECQIRTVLEDVLKQLISEETSLQQKKEDVSSLSETELIEQLCKIQRDKRCLIVVDDLWKLSHWGGFKHAFLVHDLQSKILITTREKEVAEIGFPLEHGLLNMEAALELLNKKAFPHKNIPEEENFNEVGKEMVKKCGYLPLAICLLGGVLRKKNSMMEWKEVNKNMNALIYRDEKEIDGVLNLTYENLPFYLKPCFLYMGIFKEDESIDANDLYRMWIAHGMISYENKDESLMEIAELYLSELASRSIVQVEIDATFPTRKYWKCKLHDVVQELCLKLGKMEEFGVQILKYQGGIFTTFQREASLQIKIRHLAIQFETEVEPDELTINCGEDTCKHLRSLRILNHVNSEAVEFPPQSIVDFQKFKFLRELVIVRFKFAGRKLPRGITNLVHLRRLRLEGCEVDELPSSIGNLVYLDTLDLSNSSNVGVPNVFKKMLRLKHLVLPYYDKEKIETYRVRLDEGVDELESLRRLDSRVHELKCMDRMKNVRQFSAYIYDNESLSGMTNAIATKWNKLVYCAIHIKEGCTSEEGLKNALTCPNLDRLMIEVKLGKVVAECGMSELLMTSKLSNLLLLESEIEDDPMEILGKLPCLIELHLHSRSFVGEEMRCPEFSFPHLKNLVLDDLPKLREWRVETGAMPLLSQLCINGCDHLERIPDGLSGISTLRTLKIYGMPELGKRVSSPSGQDFHKVRHVPSLIIA